MRFPPSDLHWQRETRTQWKEHDKQRSFIVRNGVDFKIKSLARRIFSAAESLETPIGSYESYFHTTLSMYSFVLRFFRSTSSRQGLMFHLLLRRKFITGLHQDAQVIKVELVKSDIYVKSRNQRVRPFQTPSRNLSTEPWTSLATDGSYESSWPYESSIDILTIFFISHRDHLVSCPHPFLGLQFRALKLNNRVIHSNGPLLNASSSVGS